MHSFYDVMKLDNELFINSEKFWKTSEIQVLSKGLNLHFDQFLKINYSLSKLKFTFT